MKVRLNFDMEKLRRLSQGGGTLWSSNLEFVQSVLDRDESELSEQELINLLSIEVQLSSDEFSDC